MRAETASLSIGGRRGSAPGQRYQDSRGPRLERRSSDPLHGIVVLSKGPDLPQSEGYRLGVTYHRFVGQRERRALVFGRQSAWTVWALGAKWRSPHRKQRYIPISGKLVPQPSFHPRRS